MADLPSRTIIREEVFEDELRVLIPHPEMADEYTAAAESVLASEPEMGVPVDAGPPEVWALPMSPVEGKTIWLLYSFDKAAVVFLGLRAL